MKCLCPCLRSVFSLSAILAFFVLDQTHLSAADGGSFTVHKDLVYSDTDQKLTLDLFIPSKTGQPSPCVIVIQGGGFNAQDGQKFRPFAEFLAGHDFAAALISYRGRPDHHYLDTMEDVKTSVRFVRKVSEQYHIDPDRIGATGRSAGGTLAALLAVTGGNEDFEGKGGHTGYSSRIQSAVAYAGVFDFVARFTDKKHIALQPNVKTKIKTNGEWVGPPFLSRDPDWLRVSAINHIDSNDPPMLFLQCKDDTTVPWLQSQEMYEALKKAGVETSVKFYEKGGHGFKDLDGESMDDMLRFFKKTL